MEILIHANENIIFFFFETNGNVRYLSTFLVLLI